MKTMAGSATVWLALILATRAMTYYVATNGVDGRSGSGDWTNAVRTISNAVTLAAIADNNVVLVSNGVYTLTAEIVVNNGTTIRSCNGSATTVVDGNYPLYSNRCFRLTNPAATLDGFTVQNGCETGTCGGGVYLDNGSSLIHCRVTGNRAATNRNLLACGGGVAVVNGSRIENCTVIANTSESVSSSGYGGGGGILIPDTGMVHNCIVVSNVSGRSGAGIWGRYAIVSNCVVAWNSALTVGASGAGLGVTRSGQVLDSTIVSNLCGWAGGGVYLGGSVTVMNCNVYGNTAYNYGGGLVAYGMASLIDRCTISNNICSGAAGSTWDGGGLYLNTNGVARNCLIRNNSTARNGGGIYAYRIGDGNGAIQSCTISGNSAGNRGGGLILSNGNNLVVNTIIWSNSAPSLPELYNAPVSQSNAYWYCCTPVALPAANQNFSSYPGCTDIDQGNFRLTNGAPCINVGTNMSDWMGSAYDLDGHARLDRFNRQVDIGAYEFISPGSMLMIR